MGLLASIGLRATVAACAAAVAALLPVTASGAEAGRFRPDDGEKTVLVLPPALANQDLAGSAAKGPDSIARDAENLAALARDSRDARYFGRAQAVLAPWLERPDATPRLLVVAADLAQQRHDFAQAQQLLDRALTMFPEDASARLMRANLLLITGDFASARKDCTAVIGSGQALAGTICLSSSLTGRGSLARARQLLASVGATNTTPAAMARWRNFTAADLAIRDGDTTAAVALLDRAAALAPTHDETRVRLAQALLASGDGTRALAVTDVSNASVALLAVRVRAASHADAETAAASRREFDALIDMGRRRGTAIHAREEGEVALYADRDAVRALELARRNFELQKDTPDLRLLVDAAIAANDRATMSYLRRWLASTGFEDRIAEALLLEAGA